MRFELVFNLLVSCNGREVTCFMLGLSTQFDYKMRFKRKKKRKDDFWRWALSTKNEKDRFGPDPTNVCLSLFDFYLY